MISSKAHFNKQCGFFLPSMWRLLLVLLLFSACLAVCGTAGVASAATPGPAWTLSSTAIPTNFSSVHDARCEARNVCDSYTLLVTNSGSEPTDGSTITISDSLPSGVTVKSVTGVEWGL